MFFLDSYCGDLYPIIRLIKMFINLIRFAVPIALILFVTIDFVKAVIANNEDEMKKAQSIVIKRLIYAVAVFLVVSLVMLVMDLVADTGVEDLAGEEFDVKSWKVCWGCDSKSECKAIDNKSNSVPSKERTDKNNKKYVYSNTKLEGYTCSGGADDPDNYFKDPDTGNLYRYRCVKK